MMSSDGDWWLCPNGTCSHGSIMHDIDDWDDPSPTCCVEGCGCGKQTDGKR